MGAKMTRTYGWCPDVPDARDLTYAHAIAQALPMRVDLRAHCSPIEDQGSIGSCTGQAIVGALEFLQIKRGLPALDLSPLFVYYNERKAERTTSVDAGAMIRTGIKSVAKLGACREAKWPYNPCQYATKPFPLCYKEALNYRAVKYQRVRNLGAMQTCLAQGFPVVFGFSVFDSFESAAVAETGVMPMPDLKKERLLGGHAVLAVGYDRLADRLICRNSWGHKWGQDGYFTMPFDMVITRDLSDDFWAITEVTF